jgi:hypothetical protein
MKITAYDIVTNTEVELDQYTYVRFGEGMQRVDVHVRDNEVEISGQQPLTVKPVASNVVIVESRRR